MNNPIPVVTDIAKVQLTEAQQQWLDNPMTQLAVNAIKQRRGEYQRRLVDRCLKLTDVNSDIQDRACIGTCDALLRIIGDIELFIKYSTMKVPQSNS